MTDRTTPEDAVRRARPATSRRVFFALWPDERVRRALAAAARTLRDECRGRAMRDHNLHLTLVFIGNVDAARIPGLKGIAKSIQGDCFDLLVDTLNYWRHNRIAWAGASSVPRALVDLVARMEVALHANGFRFDARDYVPHITLLRNAVQAPRLPKLTPIVWHARQFALVESVRDDGGSRYRVLESWALGPEPEPTAYNRDSGPAGPDENDG